MTQGVAFLAVGEFVAEVHVVEGVGAVADGVDLVAQAAFLQGIEGELDVVFVVLDEEDFLNFGR